MGVFVGLQVDCVWNVGSDLQAGVEIYYQGHLRFWLISSSQKLPPFGTPISAPRVLNWRPHISMPMISPDLISSCAPRYRSMVPPPILWAIGPALAGQVTRGNDANFSDFCIMTPLDEPVVP